MTLHTITALKGKPGEREITVDLPDHMTGDEYQQRAMRTLAPQEVAWGRMTKNPMFWTQLLHSIIGMMGELGEICTAVQSVVWYGKGDLDHANLSEEYGDLEWYHAEGVDALRKGGSKRGLDAVMVTNILKLIARYPDKFSEFLAAEENRSRAGERDVLERTIPERSVDELERERVNAPIVRFKVHECCGNRDPHLWVESVRELHGGSKAISKDSTISELTAAKARDIYEAKLAALRNDPEDAYVKEPLDKRISRQVAEHVAQGRDVNLTIDGQVVQTIKASDPLAEMNAAARAHVASQQKGKIQPGLYELYDIIAGQAAEWNLVENIPGTEVELALKTALQHMINEAQHQAGDMRSLQEDAAKAVYRNTIRLLRKDQEEKVHAPGVGHSY